MPRAESGDPLERQQLVAQVDQHRAAEDEVELPELLRRRVVDAHHDALHARTERLVGDREAVAAGALGEGLGPAPRRPVELALVVEVEGDHIGAAALHLECPEPVPGADVERAHPVHALGQPVARDVGAQVEPAGRRPPRPELDRVVPVHRVDAVARFGVRGRHGREARPSTP